MITRSEIARRQGTVWQPGTVPYSQTRWHAGPYGSFRADCSGYISGTLGLTWSYDTVGLVGLCDQIDPAELLRGDLIGLMLPGDDGHVMSFEAWDGDGLIIWEQAGGTVGQTRRTIDAIPAGYSCYRYNGIEEDELTPEQATMLTEVWQRMQATDQRIREGILIGAMSMDDVPGTGPDQPIALNHQLDEITGLLREVLRRLEANSPEHVHSLAAGQTGPATGA